MTKIEAAQARYIERLEELTVTQQLLIDNLHAQLALHKQSFWSWLFNRKGRS